LACTERWNIWMWLKRRKLRTETEKDGGGKRGIYTCAKEMDSDGNYARRYHPRQHAQRASFTADADGLHGLQHTTKVRVTAIQDGLHFTAHAQSEDGLTYRHRIYYAWMLDAINLANTIYALSTITAELRVRWDSLVVRDSYNKLVGVWDRQSTEPFNGSIYGSKLRLIG